MFFFAALLVLCTSAPQGTPGLHNTTEDGALSSADRNRMTTSTSVTENNTEDGSGILPTAGLGNNRVTTSAGSDEDPHHEADSVLYDQAGRELNAQGHMEGTTQRTIENVASPTEPGPPEQAQEMGQNCGGGDLGLPGQAMMGEDGRQEADSGLSGQAGRKLNVLGHEEGAIQHTIDNMTSPRGQENHACAEEANRSRGGDDPGLQDRTRWNVNLLDSAENEAQHDREDVFALGMRPRSERVNNYGRIRQLLEGRGHMEPDDPEMWRAGRSRPEQQLRGLARETTCTWTTTALARLQMLRAQNRGWENLWAQVVRAVVQRGDVQYETFASVYLQWLRAEFGPRFLPNLCGSMTEAEWDFAREVEMATYQDYQAAVVVPVGQFDISTRPAERRTLREDLRKELRRLQRSGELQGLRDALHHALAERGDYHFACYVLGHLGDVAQALPTEGERQGCSSHGRMWVRWVVDGYWQFYCMERARPMQSEASSSTEAARVRSRSRDEGAHSSPVQSWEDDEDEGDEAAMMAGRGTPRRSRSTRRSPQRGERCTRETRVLRPGSRPIRHRPFPETRESGRGSGAGSSTDRPGRTAERAGDRGGRERRPRTTEVAVGMDLDRAVETWRYLLGLTQVWPPPTVISDGSPLLQRSTLDEIIAFLQNQDRDAQAMMTLGFISLIRFLMAEVAEACHTASVLAAGLSVDCEESGEEVEVEIHDEEGLLQLWWKAEETDEAWLMQRDQVDKMDRWHRLLHALQRELTQQSKDRRRSHLMQLRARIFHVTIPGAWTQLQDQLYALVLGMMDEDRTHPVAQDDKWMEEWGNWRNLCRDSRSR